MTCLLPYIAFLGLIQREGSDVVLPRLSYLPNMLELNVPNLERNYEFRLSNNVHQRDMVEGAYPVRLPLVREIQLLCCYPKVFIRFDIQFIH